MGLFETPKFSGEEEESVDPDEQAEKRRFVEDGKPKKSKPIRLNPWSTRVAPGRPRTSLPEKPTTTKKKRP